MHILSPQMIAVALDKAELDPLTYEEQEICEEWTLGQASDYIKVDTNDPRLLEYAALYDKLENEKAAVWLINDCSAHSFRNPIQKRFEPDYSWNAIGPIRQKRSIWVTAHSFITCALITLSRFKKCLFRNHK